MDATDKIARRKSGELTAEQVMAETFDRIEATNPELNAIVALRSREECLAEARAMDQAGFVSPLMGLPIAIKDLAETKGLTTTYGSPLFADNVPKADSLMVSRIRDAGAIIIGKTNTPEFGLGSHSYNPVYGTTRNPYDPKLSAGGSSGGAAVALATHMLDIADGSDMMGSLRNPASWNNVYGFRPSYGLVPDTPKGDTFLHQLATSGPMARSVRDLSLLLGIQAGTDPRLPHSGAVFDGMETPPKGSNIGWIGDWNGYYPMDDDVLALCETALGVFENLGYRVKKVTPTIAPKDLWQSWITLRSWAIACGQAPLFDDPAKRAKLKPEMLWEIERGRALSAQQVHDASVIRSNWFTEVATMQGVDFLALPSAQIFPFPTEWDWPKSIGNIDMDTYHRWMEVVVPASLIGVPALNVPAGFNDAGLPMGLQLIGRRGADAQVLGAGQEYHLATDWPGQRPPSVADIPLS